MHQKEKIHRSKITKKAKGLYSENYTPLKKEIEENTNKWKIFCAHRLGTNIVKMSVTQKVKSLSHVQLFVTPWTVACQAPPSMGISRQEYWSGLPFPSPGDLPNPGAEM